MDLKLRNNNNPWHLQSLQQLAVSLLIPARRLSLNTKRQAYWWKCYFTERKVHMTSVNTRKSRKSKARPSVLAIVHENACGINYCQCLFAVAFTAPDTFYREFFISQRDKIETPKLKCMQNIS